MPLNQQNKILLSFIKTWNKRGLSLTRSPLTLSRQSIIIIILLFEQIVVIYRTSTGTKCNEGKKKEVEIKTLQGAQPLAGTNRFLINYQRG